MLEGTVSYEGDATGKVRLDLLTQEGISAPQLVSAEEISGLGPFSIKVPQNFGQLHILGFVDQESDGPSEGEPAGKLTIEVGEVDITGLELVMSMDPELGSLRPGPPPTDQPPQPDGSDQPSGADHPVEDGLPAPGEVGGPAVDGEPGDEAPADAPPAEGAADDAEPEAPPVE